MKPVKTWNWSSIGKIAFISAWAIGGILLVTVILSGGRDFYPSTPGPSHSTSNTVDIMPGVGPGPYHPRFNP